MKLGHPCMRRIAAGIAVLASASTSGGCSGAGSAAERTRHTDQASSCGVFGPGQTLVVGDSVLACDRETQLTISGGQLVLSYDDVALWTSPNTVPGGIAKIDESAAAFELLTADGSQVVWEYVGSPPPPPPPGPDAGSVRPTDDGGVACRTIHVEVDPFVLKVVDNYGNVCFTAK